MFESLLVALIVLVAALYAVWALLPAVTRGTLAQRGARALGGPGAPGLAGRIAARLQKLAKSPAGCNDCPAATLTPAERAGKKPGERDQGLSE